MNGLIEQNHQFFVTGDILFEKIRIQEIFGQRHGRRLFDAVLSAPAAFERDRQARLLMYRGPFDDSEWTSYHPEAKRIFTAFANGVNAFARQNANNLPVEFKLTGTTPQPWTAETVVLRTTGMGDGNAELQLARLVARVGVREANRQRMPDPWDELVVPDGLDVTHPISVPDKPALEGLENKWNERWTADAIYQFDRSRSRADVYSIDTPPPTVSGSLHVTRRRPPPRFARRFLRA